VSKYVEFPLEGGGSIVIESADEPARTPSGFLRAGEGGDAAHPAQGTFDASVESVRRSAELLVSKLRSLSSPPDELEISFSLKASSEAASLVVGKAGGDANFGVLLRWRSEKAKEEEASERQGDAEQGSKDPGEHYKQRQRRTLPPQQAARHVDDDDDDDQDDENRL
jgi:hypothetical protein